MNMNFASNIDSLATDASQHDGLTSGNSSGHGGIWSNCPPVHETKKQIFSVHNALVDLLVVFWPAIAISIKPVTCAIVSLIPTPSTSSARLIPVWVTGWKIAISDANQHANGMHVT